ncbi:MAG: peptidoglycan-binding protein, partial [Cellvibrionaceae bacterium]|nr:peptidoglycan-binding protein [Cellvibrionaceae bacterium]
FSAGPALVNWLASAFARIDQRDDLLATAEFTSLLKQRVILFQKEHNLVEDGIAGIDTLLKINEKLGVAITLNPSIDVATLKN